MHYFHHHGLPHASAPSSRDLYQHVKQRAQHLSQNALLNCSVTHAELRTYFFLTQHTVSPIAMRTPAPATTASITPRSANRQGTRMLSKREKISSFLLKPVCVWTSWRVSKHTSCLQSNSLWAMLTAGQHKPFPRGWRPSNKQLLAVEHNRKTQLTHPTSKSSIQLMRC